MAFVSTFTPRPAFHHRPRLTCRPSHYPAPRICMSNARPYSIGVRREDLSKKGEKRVPITPHHARKLASEGHAVLVQPGEHPTEKVNKRAFPDAAYASAGATVTDDLSAADVLFGIKEVDVEHILPDKAYFCFSHTHKGQVKNRPLLKAFMDARATLFDYELIAAESGAPPRSVFSTFAGYAGMVDSLWTVGRRYAARGIDHPFCGVQQAIETESLAAAKRQLAAIGDIIRTQGTPQDLPPFIMLVLGNGKVSAGVQEVFDILPVETIQPDDLERVFTHGSRNAVYRCVLRVPDTFRLKDNTCFPPSECAAWGREQVHVQYLTTPEYFESKLDDLLPYASLLMNCVSWSPKYPRALTRAMAREYWAKHRTLEAIGDITCDPEGSIEFSHETWIDDPVFVYDPRDGAKSADLAAEGIAVMAVTNLPCELSEEASEQFSDGMEPVVGSALKGDFSAATIDESRLPSWLKQGCILWRGKLTPEYAYMAEYVETAEKSSLQQVESRIGDAQR